MPQAIPIVTLAAAAGASAAFTGTAFTILGLSVTYGAIASVGITVAGSLLSGALAKRPGAPRVSAERQLTTNQAATHRFRCFGRVKVGGALALYDVTDSDRLVQVVVHGQGEHAAVLGHELDGEAVTVGADGWVTSPSKWAGRVQIRTASGAAGQAAMPELVALFPYWTAEHRLRGLAYTMVLQRKVGARSMAKTYPQGVLSYRQTLDGARDILDPRTGVRAWSDNPALLAAWRLTSADGHALPEARLNWGSFAACADVCDMLIPLKAGGVERQFRAAGRFSYDEAPSEVTRQILACCDGDLYIDDDGLVAMRIGDATVSNDAHFEAPHVAAMRWRKGPGLLDRYNAVTAVYTDPRRDYQPVSAPTIRDAAAVAAAGVERVFELELGFCPSGTQAQRLAKRMLYKLNPAYQGTITTTLAGLAARQRARCRLVFDAAPSSLPLIVSRAETDLASLTVTLDVQTIDPAAYAWNPAADEIEAPVPVALGARGQILAPPAGVVFSVSTVAVDAVTTGLVIRATWAAPSDDTLSAELQVSRAGLNEWETFLAADARAGSLRSAALDRGLTYDARLRFVGPGGGATGFVSAPAPLTASGGATPPSPVGTWAATQSGPTAPVTVVGTVSVPNAPNLWRLRVYRGSAAQDFAAATEIATIYGVAFGDYAISEPLAPGAWRYWALLETTAPAQSPVAGPYAVTVTSP